MGSRSQDFNSHGSQTKSRMGKGQNEGGFSAEQIEMYKECFKLMDVNKDGTLDKNDLRGDFDNVGVLMSEGELDGLLGEISGPCTFDNMVKMFQEKMAGDGNDPDDLIIQAFKAYDAEGKIDVKMLPSPEMATTPTTLSSRLSRLMTLKARLTSRCCHLQ